MVRKCSRKANVRSLLQRLFQRESDWQVDDERIARSEQRRPSLADGFRPGRWHDHLRELAANFMSKYSVIRDGKITPRSACGGSRPPQADWAQCHSWLQQLDF